MYYVVRAAKDRRLKPKKANGHRRTDIRDEGEIDRQRRSRTESIEGEGKRKTSSNEMLLREDKVISGNGSS